MIRREGTPSTARHSAAPGHPGPFELAILDRYMPVMDGLMLARAIKTDLAIRDVRLAMLTSLGQPGWRDSQAAHDFLGVLTKPIRQSQLPASLITCLGQPVEPAAPPAAPTAAPEPGTQTVVPRILVAEDNSVNQRVVVRMLERLGYHADIVDNGAEAVAAVARFPYAAILMDCQMPEMDGYEATEAIRTHERETIGRGRRVPILALTANAMPADRERCLLAGMDDCLAKATRPDALVGALARWARTTGPLTHPASTPSSAAHKFNVTAPGTRDTALTPSVR